MFQRFLAESARTEAAYGHGKMPRTAGRARGREPLGGGGKTGLYPLRPEPDDGGARAGAGLPTAEPLAQRRAADARLPDAAADAAGADALERSARRAGSRDPRRRDRHDRRRLRLRGVLRLAQPLHRPLLRSLPRHRGAGPAGQQQPAHARRVRAHGRLLHHELPRGRL